MTHIISPKTSSIILKIFLSFYAVGLLIWAYNVEPIHDSLHQYRTITLQIRDKKCQIVFIRSSLQFLTAFILNTLVSHFYLLRRGFYYFIFSLLDYYFLYLLEQLKANRSLNFVLTSYNWCVIRWTCKVYGIKVL